MFDPRDCWPESWVALELLFAALDDGEYHLKSSIADQMAEASGLTRKQVMSLLSVVGGRFGLISLLDHSPKGRREIVLTRLGRDWLDRGQPEPLGGWQWPAVTPIEVSP